MFRTTRAKITGPLDAFQRVRVSNPTTVFDSSYPDPRFWDEKLVGYATSVLTVPNGKILSVIAGGDEATSQTFMRFYYQPGKSQQVMMTGRFSPEAGVVKRVGQFDGQNGIFLRVGDDEAEPSWHVMRGGVVTESAPQSEWSLDLLPSLDMSMAQIVAFDYQWLGVGTIRVGFFIDGEPRYVHAFHHANRSAVHPYMATANLPLRCDIASEGGAGSLEQGCSSVTSEGGIERIGTLHSIDNGITTVSAVTAGDLVALLAVRLRADRPDVILVPELANVLVTTTNDNVRLALMINPTLAASPYLDWQQETAFEWAVGTAAQLVTDPGDQIYSAYAPSDVRVLTIQPPSAQRIGVSIDGESDVLVLAAESLTNNVSLAGALTIRSVP